MDMKFKIIFYDESESVFNKFITGLKQLNIVYEVVDFITTYRHVIGHIFTVDESYFELFYKYTIKQQKDIREWMWKYGEDN